MKTTQKTRIICLILVVLFSFLTIGANASTNASDYLRQYSGNIVSNGGGKISIEFKVFGYSSMTQIGVSKIVLYEKAASASTWTYKKTFLSDDYPDMLASGTSYGSSVDYDGTSGASYKALITVYAANSSGSDSKTFEVYS